MTTVSLPRSAPSAQGVDATGILSLLDAVQAAHIDLHSLMILRHGHVVAEGWWAPYRADLPHLLYSLSKSFTSTAIGIAGTEGLLSVDDRVVRFFPDKVPPDVSPFVQEMKVRHLLAMASGHAEDTWGKLHESGPDIVAAFLSLPPDHEPGSLFCYNQGCTYTLSAIITKLTGQRLSDYLGPRLFEPLGIDQPRWEQTAEGIDQGFSGLYVTTESIAKLGQLHLQNGRWNGRQLIAESYLAQAHTKQVDNAAFSENLDWQQGYGFQFWMCRHSAYRGDGAFGQFCVVLPEADAVIACTAQSTDMQQELDLFWQHLLPALSGERSADSATERELVQRLGNLSTPGVEAHATGTEHAVSFERVTEPESPDRLTAIRVEPAAHGTRLLLQVDGSDYPFDLRPGHWSEGELPGYQVAVTGGWASDDQFLADVVFVNMPHRLHLVATVADEPTVEIRWHTVPLPL